jgi:7 transmembrane receptor (rhodopsin family)
MAQTEHSFCTIIFFDHLQEKQQKSRHQHQYASQLDEYKMTKTFSIIIAVYIVCSTPLLLKFFSLAYYTKLEEVCENKWIIKTFDLVTDCTAHLNSAINPFIYAYRIKAVRSVFKRFSRKNTVSTNKETAGDDPQPMNRLESPICA